jgi:hypothetical protein
LRPAQGNSSPNNQSKMDWRCGSSGREPVLQAQSLSSNSKPKKKKKKKKERKKKELILILGERNGRNLDATQDFTLSTNNLSPKIILIL